jgi:NAD(P)-dependent dehydrogenase (short-subunit alcohol dehydrogenase family)
LYIGGASREIGKAIAASSARGGASLIAISARSAAYPESVAEELKAATAQTARRESGLLDAGVQSAAIIRGLRRALPARNPMPGA